MQGVEEVERVCCQSVLARAEAHMRELCAEPTARECFELCAHHEACARVLGIAGHDTEGDVPDVLGCADACQEYEERNGRAM